MPRTKEGASSLICGSLDGARAGHQRGGLGTGMECDSRRCVSSSRRETFGMTHPSIRAAAGAALSTMILFAACSRGPAGSSAPAPSTRVVARYADGGDVVEAMHARYAGKWYRTLTFRQKTSRLLPNNSWKVETWYESMRVPGRLRIDFDPVSAGNGVLYARDSQFVASNGRVIQSSPGINDLLLLGFDVYANTAARTEALMRRQGIDLNRVHE